MLTASRLPSGETLNVPTSSGKCVACLGTPPLAGITYTCWLPDCALRKYSHWPSLEYAGELTFQPTGVRRVGAASPARRSRIHSEVDALPRSSPLPPSISRLAYTTRPPSGESTGEDTRSSRCRSRTSKPRAASAGVAAIMPSAAARASGRIGIVDRWAGFIRGSSRVNPGW